MFFFAPKLTEGKCPVCGGDLYVGGIFCDTCHAHYPVEGPDFPIASIKHIDEDAKPYLLLTKEESQFLKRFLVCEGNFKALGEELQLSYPAVKKKYTELLTKLGFSETVIFDDTAYSDLDMSAARPSDIIMGKLIKMGGSAEIPLCDKGKYCTIRATVDSDGNKCFVCDKLNHYAYHYKFSAFDTIVELLKKNGGVMKKGNGRFAKVGEEGCTDDTLVGRFAKEYFGKRDGESTYDPIFVFPPFFNGQSLQTIAADI